MQQFSYETTLSGYFADMVVVVVVAAARQLFFSAALMLKVENVIVNNANR